MHAKWKVEQSIGEVSRRSSAEQLGLSAQLLHTVTTAPPVFSLKHSSFGCLLLHEGVPGNRTKSQVVDVVSI